MKKLLFVLSLIFLLPMSYSHEGHKLAPGSFKVIHGGEIKVGKELNLEVIIKKNEVTIYCVSHDSKDIPKDKVKLSAIAKPKKKKSYPVDFKDLAPIGYIANVDLSGENRLPIEVTVEYQGKKDVYKIQVEE